MTVTSGTAALRSAWRQITRASEMPFTRAATMYSWLSSFSMKERVMRLI